ncbi:flowering-promoting factor 1-like protein 1 [Bidens hawaiensis]|uniref:flowering-promoting factor 1-like protein 1 n=1 Tax=Bidens hawaiensis TaxID=980011 RepID=UPI00404B9D7A
MVLTYSSFDAIESIMYASYACLLCIVSYVNGIDWPHVMDVNRDVIESNGIEWCGSTSGEPNSDSVQGTTRRKVLVHVPTNEVVTSYHVLERLLASLGWERYYDDPNLLQFHKRSSVHLISLPKDFNKFKSMHMFDIVVKNRNMF